MDNVNIINNIEKQEKINTLDAYINKAKKIYFFCLWSLCLILLISHILLFLYVGSVLTNSSNLYFLYAWACCLSLIIPLIVMVCQVDKYKKAQKIRDSIRLNGMKLSQDIINDYKEISKLLFFPKN